MAEMLRSGDQYRVRLSNALERQAVNMLRVEKKIPSSLDPIPRRQAKKAVRLIKRRANRLS